MTTGNTLEDREAKLQALFDDVAGFSDTTRDFLRDERRQHHPLVDQSPRSSCRVFAQYSPEFPCLTQRHRERRHAARPRRSAGSRLHINLELLPNQPRAYNAEDEPRYGDERGPYCLQACPTPRRKYNQDNLRPELARTSTTASTSRPARAPAAPAAWATPCYAGSAEEAGLHPAAAGRSAGTCPSRGVRPGRACCSARSPVGRR